MSPDPIRDAARAAVNADAPPPDDQQQAAISAQLGPHMKDDAADDAA